MTQPELVLAWISEHGAILPAKMGKVVYKGIMFGSETSKRCRELRKRGILESKREGKFERFFRVNVPDTKKDAGGDGERPVLQHLFAAQPRM
jgi:hypothetical protein